MTIQNPANIRPAALAGALLLIAAGSLPAGATGPGTAAADGAAAPSTIAAGDSRSMESAPDGLDGAESPAAGVATDELIDESTDVRHARETGAAPVPAESAVAAGAPAKVTPGNALAEPAVDDAAAAPGDAAAANTATDDTATDDTATDDTATDDAGAANVLRLLGTDVPPGHSARLDWTATELFEGVPVSTPVLVINGSEPGPTLCMSAAVHGDELNGIEIVRRVMHDISPKRFSGALIGIPIVNVQGFRRGSRYLPDRRDLNRYFPGNPNGSAAARIAHSFFVNVISHCDALIDLHTGSFERANLPQIRADLRNPDVVTLTQSFGATVILHSTPGAGTLRHAATEAGIPTVTLEAGGPLQLELNEVKHGVKGIETLLNSLGMTKRSRFWGDPEPVYYRSSWVRADSGGILLSDVSLGSTVRRGDLLGTITDPMNNAQSELRSPYSGRIIGMARNQVVMPGFAAFHVGIQTDQAPVEIVDASLQDDSDSPGDTADSDESDDTGNTPVSTEDGAYIDGISE